MKAFVRQDCSARLARARLRQSGPTGMEFKAGDLIMYRKAEGPRWHGPGHVIGFDLKVLWTLHQGTPVAVTTGRARPANVSEILAHMVLGDRVSKRKVDQFRAAGQQQGFVDISGRRRTRSEVETGEQDEELEQPPVRARTAQVASSESPQLERRSSAAGAEVGRTTSAEGEGESQQPEAEPATPLGDAWLRRNPSGTPDPGIWLVGHLRGRPGSAAESSVADRERSRSEEGDGSGGGETANLAALMARAESAEERHRDDAVEAARRFIDWQAWWSERVQEGSTEEWKQKRMRVLGKSQKLQKRGKLLQYAKEPEHVQRGLDEARLAEWEKWLKHSAADVVSPQGSGAAGLGGSRRDWNSVDRGRSQLEDSSRVKANR